jgi:hypothetical protein
MEQKLASLKLAVDHNELKLVKNIIATERTIHGLIVNINFRTPEWAELSKFANFSRDGKSYFVPLDAVEECYIPWECLESKGSFTIGIFGVGDSVRLPTTKLRFNVEEGCLCDGSEPADPTPELWEMMIALSNEAVRVAQSVRSDADAGKFDGQVGEKGDKGDTGANGLTPYINDNGNWQIGDEDTGIKAVGANELQIALDNIPIKVVNELPLATTETTNKIYITNERAYLGVKGVIF